MRGALKNNAAMKARFTSLSSTQWPNISKNILVPPYCGSCSSDCSLMVSIAPSPICSSVMTVIEFLSATGEIEYVSLYLKKSIL